MSITTTTTATATTFKVELRRQPTEATFHRFSGVYTFSELTAIITHLWGDRQHQFAIQYTDDEGDQVSLTSEAEWTECLRVFQEGKAPVLRLLALGSAELVEKQKVGDKKPVQQTGAAAAAAATSSTSNDNDCWKQFGDCLRTIETHCANKRKTEKQQSAEKEKKAGCCKPFKFFACVLMVILAYEHSCLYPLCLVYAVSNVMRCASRWCRRDLCCGQTRSQAASPVTSTAAATTASTSAAAAATPSDVAALQEVFPTMKAEEAAHLLKCASGNVSLAVNGRLGGAW